MVLTSNSSTVVLHFSRFILLIAQYSCRGLHTAACTTAVAPAPTRRQCLKSIPGNLIGLDKNGFQVNIFFLFLHKNMLWVLIRIDLCMVHIQIFFLFFIHSWHTALDGHLVSVGPTSRC